MSVTDTLKHEHEVVLLALEGAEAQADRLAGGDFEAADVIEKMTEFFREFVDRCHHAKEERLLFPRLEELGMPREGGPIGVMLTEHEQGRAHVRAMLEDLPQVRQHDRHAAGRVQDNLLGYIDLLRQHIGKENDCLFPMADEALTAADQEELAAAFDKVEAEEIGAGVHERYHELAHHWAHMAAAAAHGGGCSACGGCR